ncbi:MAG: anti-sigma factor [Phycisphaeraceae bacterium]|nr:anti-sigma factor [Phycisphaeraceae bacterium]MCW5763817.1 anti-sigma factor [Phycisphaeraceae bacterium]
MTAPLTPSERSRLLELLVDHNVHGLDPDERAEMDAMLTSASLDHDVENVIGNLIVALDEANSSPQNTDTSTLPANLRSRLIESGQRIVRGEKSLTASSDHQAASSIGSISRRRAFPRWVPVAATIALLVGVVAVSGRAIMLRQSELEKSNSLLSQAQQQLESLQQQVDNNRAILAAARERAEALSQELALRDDTLASQAVAMAQAAQREIELVERLSLATEDLSLARLAIARYETPVDPAELAANRRKLLDFPDTVRIGWAPFDLPDNPAEKQGVSGDVVWNDELQQGFLRFVGLDPNDPNIEQYQVWIIDERGMEQKVSGGVFNATAEGEVIVPIRPGIDVRRVALFAITIEDPGGTWVPDLRRRVVVAPREGS